MNIVAASVSVSHYTLGFTKAAYNKEDINKGEINKGFVLLHLTSGNWSWNSLALSAIGPEHKRSSTSSYRTRGSGKIYCRLTDWQTRLNQSVLDRTASTAFCGGGRGGCYGKHVTIYSNTYYVAVDQNGWELRPIIFYIPVWSVKWLLTLNSPWIT